MDIHPDTNHDIARLRNEARLLRAEAAERAHQVREGRRVERGAVLARSATIRLLQRIGRREVVKPVPNVGPDAV